MPATKQNNIGLWQGWSPGEDGWGDEMNYNLRSLDTLVQAFVLGILAAPPGSPSDGDTYIVDSGGTGAFSGQDDKIARYDGSAWEFYPSKDGWRVFNQADNAYYRHVGGSWQLDTAEAATGSTLAVRTPNGQINVANPTSGGHSVNRDYADSNYEKKRQNNLTATTDPTATDDASAGYEVLSRWVNTASGEIFICLDATNGSASWGKATLTLDELGSAALADVGESAGDVMAVGAFGIGAGKVGIPGNNADTLTTPGIYGLTTGDINGTPSFANESLGVASGSTLFHTAYNDTNWAQMLFVHSRNEVFTRINDGGAVSNWTPLYSEVTLNIDDYGRKDSENTWQESQTFAKKNNVFDMGPDNDVQMRLKSDTGNTAMLIRYAYNALLFLPTAEDDEDGTYNDQRPLVFYGSDGGVLLNGGSGNTGGVAVGDPTDGRLDPGTLNAEGLAIDGQLLNVNEFGGDSGSLGIGTAVSTSVAQIFLPTLSYNNPVSITVSGTFTLIDANGSTIQTGVGAADIALNVQSGPRNTRLVISNLSGLDVGAVVELRASSGSKITVNF